jgi:predicted RNA-binding Zn-ribbon protein involved in translation (DUF1610 family)
MSKKGTLSDTLRMGEGCDIGHATGGAMKEIPEAQLNYLARHTGWRGWRRMFAIVGLQLFTLGIVLIPALFIMYLITRFYTFDSFLLGAATWLAIGMGVSYYIFKKWQIARIIDFSSPSFPCPYCGTDIKASHWKCHCGRKHERFEGHLIVQECEDCKVKPSHFVCPKCNNRIVLDKTRADERYDATRLGWQGIPVEPPPAPEPPPEPPKSPLWDIKDREL